MKWFLTIVLACSVCGSQAQTLKDGEMPQMPVFPEIPAPLPVGSVKMGNSDSLYAFTMAVPEAGSQVTIHSLKKGQEKVKNVSLLGNSDKLKWRQTPDGLVITCPKKLDFATSLVFKIIVQ